MWSSHTHQLRAIELPWLEKTKRQQSKLQGLPGQLMIFFIAFPNWKGMLGCVGIQWQIPIGLGGESWRSCNISVTTASLYLMIPGEYSWDSAGQLHTLGICNGEENFPGISLSPHPDVCGSKWIKTLTVCLTSLMLSGFQHVSLRKWDPHYSLLSALLVCLSAASTNKVSSSWSFSNRFSREISDII